MKDNVIEDISFDGEACVVSISSTSILSNLVKGKSIDDAIDIIRNYNNMIEEKEYDKDIIEDAIVFDDVAKQPSRIKCATLTWNGLYNKLMELKRNE